MSDFRAKMHQIQFRLGLCRRPRWMSLQRSPHVLARFQGPILKGGRERGGEWEGERGEEREGEGISREGRGGDPNSWFTRPKILKNTLLAKLM